MQNPVLKLDETVDLIWEPLCYVSTKKVKVCEGTLLIKDVFI